MIVVWAGQTCAIGNVSRTAGGGGGTCPPNDIATKSVSAILARQVCVCITYSDHGGESIPFTYLHFRPLYGKLSAFVARFGVQVRVV